MTGDGKVRELLGKEEAKNSRDDVLFPTFI